MLAFKCEGLPDWCFVVIPGNPPGSRIGVVRLGMNGYWPSGADYRCKMTVSQLHDKVRELNRPETTALMEDCMQLGSMMGWDIPGADPKYMLEKHADMYTEGGEERVPL